MNVARPVAGVRLCGVAEIADPGSRGFVFSAGDDRFAGFVVRTGERVTGWIDSCPHARWPLAWREHDYLTREGDLIVCAGHGALFRPADGLCIAGPCAGRALASWPVEVRDGVVTTV